MAGEETSPHHHNPSSTSTTAPATTTATPATTATSTLPITATSTDGMFSNPHQQASSSGHYSSSEGTTLVSTPHSVTGKAPVGASAFSGIAKRKVGRPRKDGPLEATVSASTLASDIFPWPSSVLPPPAPRKTKRSSTSPSSSSKKPRLDALANAGEVLILHVITVAAGEDVAQKIMLFMLQHKCEVCIITASGSISKASINQPSVLEHLVTYKGRFEILSLSGSFQPAELAGIRGGLSVCLSGSDGHIIGGAVGGFLTAAGPVKVLVGSFTLETKKDLTTGPKADASASGLPIPVAVSSIPTPDFPGTMPVSGNEGQQNICGSNFVLKSWTTHLVPSLPTDWRGGLDAGGNANIDMTGKTGHEDDIQLQD